MRTIEKCDEIAAGIVGDYKSTGLKPLGCHARVMNGGTCAMGVYSYARGADANDLDRLYGIAEENLGCEFTAGIQMGFDTYIDPERTHRPCYSSGSEDVEVDFFFGYYTGMMVAKLCQQNGLV